MSKNSEIFDYKRFVLLNKKKVAAIFIFAAIFAVLAAGVYYLKAKVFAGPDVYRCQAMYYITFDRDEYEPVYDYYNDATWNTVIDSDPLLGMISDNTNVAPEKIMDMTSIPTMSDIRMIHVYVDSTDKDEALLIQEGIASAFNEFADKTAGFTSIDMWDGPRIQMMEKDFFIGRIVGFAGVVGMFVGILYMFWKSASDTKVYTLADIKDATGVVPAGIVMKEFDDQLFQHINTIRSKNGYKKTAVIYAESMCEKNSKPIDIDEFKDNKYEVLYNDGDSFYDKLVDCDSVILLASFGKIEKAVLSLAADNLKIYDKKADMIVLADANEDFCKAYYLMGK